MVRVGNIIALEPWSISFQLSTLTPHQHLLFLIIVYIFDIYAQSNYTNELYIIYIYVQRGSLSCIL